MNDNDTLADDLRKDSLALMALLATERKKIDLLREVANTKGVRSEEMASAIHAVLASPSQRELSMSRRGTTMVFKGKMAEAVLNALSGREVIPPHKAVAPCYAAVGTGRCNTCGWLVANHGAAGGASK